MYDHYLHTAHAAAGRLDPARPQIVIGPPRAGAMPERVAGHDGALEWFAAEHAVLLRVVDSTAATAAHWYTGRLAWALVPFLTWQGHWYDVEATQQVALTAARHLADIPGQADAARFLARAYSWLGRLDDAHDYVRQALDLLGPDGDPAARGNTHHAFASVLDKQGRHREALHHAEQALTLFRAARRRRGQGQALNWIGWLYARLGEHERALGYCRQALALLDEVGDPAGQGNVWDSLGYAHHHLGRHDEAVVCYRHALDLYRDVGDRFSEAETLTHIGDAYHATGDPTAAHDAWTDALAICDELALPSAAEIRAKLARPGAAVAVLPAR
jgi:tetratricopeptide (TPR) repeat protein